jgi:aspartate-semialdehyde dehydrogenase
VESVLKLALVSANGLVTESLLAVIEEHAELSGEVTLLGNANDCPTPVEFNQQTLLIEDIDDYGFDGTDILISTGELAYRGDWLDRACDAGCIVLDVGGHLPGQAQRPRIVAGVNNAELEDLAPGSLVVVPAGAVTLAARLLHPLVGQMDLERVSLFNCHPVSDLGRAGVEEMARQTAQMLNGKPARPQLFPCQVAFNLLPAGSDEVMGLSAEPQSGFSEQLGQILSAPELNLMVSNCWVPVFYGLTQALHITAKQDVDIEAVQRILTRMPDIQIKWGADEPPTAVTEGSGSDCMTVGGLSAGVKNSTDFSLWAVADNLRYGIAGNAVKIIELLVKRLFISYS